MAAFVFIVIVGCSSNVSVEAYNQLENELNELNQQIESLETENASLEQTMNNTTEKPESSSNVSAKQVWNYCADRKYEYFVDGGMTDSQIEQQAYADAANHFGISVSEVKRLYQEHANSLSGSSSNTSSATSDYDSDYQSNLEKIADAYGVTPEEVDAKIKAVTGE